MLQIPKMKIEKHIKKKMLQIDVLKKLILYTFSFLFIGKYVYIPVLNIDKELFESANTFC